MIRFLVVFVFSVFIFVVDVADGNVDNPKTFGAVKLPPELRENEDEFLQDNDDRGRGGKEVKGFEEEEDDKSDRNREKAKKKEEVKETTRYSSEDPPVGANPATMNSHNVFVSRVPIFNDTENGIGDFDLNSDFELVVETRYYDLPIVKKDDIRYFDISKVLEKELEIVGNLQEVRGITAGSSECRVEVLAVLTGYRLHEDLLSNCNNLKNMTLAGIYDSMLICFFILDVKFSFSIEYLDFLFS